jgi:RNA polymerase sigma-70 factor, ECF subfamily
VYHESSERRSDILNNRKRQGSTLKDSWFCRTRFGYLALPAPRPRRLSLGALLELILNAVGALPPWRPASSAEIALVRSMAQKGSPAAEEIYRLYSQRIYQFIYWRVREQVEDAEELTLDTFLSAISLCKSFDGRSSVFVWLCGIAKLRMVDSHRRRNRAKRQFGKAPVSLDDLDDVSLLAAMKDVARPEELLDRIHASQLMDVALKSLTPDESEALLLLYVDGLSVRELAAHLQRSEDAIDAMTRRAKAKLRKALLTLMGEEDSVD